MGNEASTVATLGIGEIAPCPFICGLGAKN